MRAYGMRAHTALQHHRANRRRGLAVDMTPAMQALAGRAESEREGSAARTMDWDLGIVDLFDLQGREWAGSGR